MSLSVPPSTIDEPTESIAFDDPPGLATRPVVAIQGELGSFSDEAVGRYWAGAASALPQIDCARVIAAVRSGRATHGVLAMENSIVGTVIEAHAALASAPDVGVIGELVLPVIQCLMAPPG